MLIETFEIIGGLVGIFAILIVVWDHFKDDRKLAKDVKIFYQDIEKLIFTFHEMKFYFDTDNFLEATNYTSNNEYYRAKVKQNYADYGKYLGLIKLEEIVKSNKVLFSYAIKEGIKILETGELRQKYSQTSEIAVINDILQISEKEIKIINLFLDYLRGYWEKHYYKRLFRPKLKRDKNFAKLSGYFSYLAYKIEKRMKRIDDIEGYMKKNLGSDWLVIENAWNKCIDRTSRFRISRNEFIKTGLLKLRKKFVGLFIRETKILDI